MHGIDSRKDLNSLVDKKVAKRDALRDAVQSMEKRITEIAALRKHIYNYSDTRATYEAYHKAGYSKKFFEAHREELTIHKAAKKAFDELGVKKIPRVRELNVEYAELMKEKKAKFREYRSACSEAREYLAIRENIASLYDAERKENADRKKRKEQER